MKTEKMHETERLLRKPPCAMSFNDILKLKCMATAFYDLVTEGAELKRNSVKPNDRYVEIKMNEPTHGKAFSHDEGVWVEILSLLDEPFEE